jgi:hypothetical protein
VTPREAIAFVRRHGVVLEAAKGLEPSLAAEVAGRPIGGNWWAAPEGHQIFELTQKVRDSKAVLVCTLAKGRITYIHERLWPAFARLAKCFPDGALDAVREVHTSSGQHRRQDVAFPDWVPGPILAAAKSLPESEARAEIETWLQRYGARSSGRHG